MRILLSIVVSVFFFVVSVVAFGQSVPASIQSMIPAEYEVLEFDRGYLNGDDIKDAILVLRRRGEDSLARVSESTIVRPTWLLIGKGLERYSAPIVNDSLVMCVNCGGVYGDPFSGIEISEESFTVYHYGGAVMRWSIDARFLFDPIRQNWFLVEIQSSEYDVTEPEHDIAPTIKRVPDDIEAVDFAHFSSYE